MKEINLIQGTPEWHSWRKNGVGGSDAAVVLHNSPYTSLYDLYALKTGHTKPEEPSSGKQFIFAKGLETEALVRPILEARIGCPLPPACGEHEEFPILRASLDGFNAERNIAAEIKLVGQAAFEMAQEGMIPPHYYDQCQHNLLVTGAETLFYACATAFDGNNEEKIAVVEMKPDKTWQDKYLPAVSDFWARVERLDPPPKTPPMQGTIIVENEGLRALASRYATLKAQALRIENEIEEVGTQLKSVVAPNTDGKYYFLDTNISITAYKREGNIQYAKIPEVKNLPQETLEKYRGKAAFVTKINVHTPKEPGAG